MTAHDLEQTLQQIGLRDLYVRVEGRPGHLVAEISSPDFAGQDEAMRQQRVWEYLVSTLSDDQRVEVEFVFTLTPEEMREVESNARS